MVSRVFLRILCSTILAALLFIVSASAQTRLLRFPHIHADRVVFTYGGDLWTAPSSGGTAVRLTAHPGVEVFARFSPDGKWIAFTGQYDGDEQVYVIPATGGVPRQLTFYPARGPLAPRWGYDNQVYGWTNDGKSIVFRSMRDSWTLPVSRLYTVAVDGGPAEPLPMPESGAGDFSPDGSRMVYSPRARDFRSEKRYGGGQANQLYIFDLKSFEAKRITDSPGEEELYLVPQDGSAPAEQLTQGGKAMRYGPVWAPDGKRLAFSDKDGKVFVLTLADHKLLEIANSGQGQVRDYTWAPYGNHLAFSMGQANGFSAIFIWSAGDGQLRKITDEMFNSTSPTWDPQLERAVAEIMKKLKEKPASLPQRPAGPVKTPK